MIELGETSIGKTMQFNYLSNCYTCNNLGFVRTTEMVYEISSSKVYLDGPYIWCPTCAHPSLNEVLPVDPHMTLEQLSRRLEEAYKKIPAVYMFGEWPQERSREVLAGTAEIQLRDIEAGFPERGDDALEVSPEKAKEIREHIKGVKEYTVRNRGLFQCPLCPSTMEALSYNANSVRTIYTVHQNNSLIFSYQFCIKCKVRPDLVLD